MIDESISADVRYVVTWGLAELAQDNGWMHVLDNIEPSSCEYFDRKDAHAYFAKTVSELVASWDCEHACSAGHRWRGATFAELYTIDNIRNADTGMIDGYCIDCVTCVWDGHQMHDAMSWRVR